MQGKSIVRNVTLTGTTDIMFDRYAGDNKTQLTPAQKLYVLPDQIVYIPALNIRSFLSAINTTSAPKMFLEPKVYKRVADALSACISISPNNIPFLRGGKPIKLGTFEEREGGVVIDPLSGIQLVHHVARLDRGIPNPKERPVIGLDWMLKFKLAVMPHPEINEELVEDLFTRGGQFLGLGTFRKVFGKFDFEWD